MSSFMDVWTLEFVFTSTLNDCDDKAAGCQHSKAFEVCNKTTFKKYFCIPSKMDKDGLRPDIYGALTDMKTSKNRQTDRLTRDLTDCPAICKVVLSKFE